MKPLQFATKLATLGVAMFLKADFAVGQGTFIFQNTGGNGGPQAAIYSFDPDQPQQQQWGNTPDASAPGTNLYRGVPLEGTNYSVQAWYSLTPASDVFQLIPDGVPVANSRSSTFILGYFSGGSHNISPAIYTPDSNFPYMVYLQVRVWDNSNGQFDTWNEAWTAAQVGSGLAVGWSKIFEQPLENRLVPWPALINFESFNIFIVPEPGTVSLLSLGGLALLMVRRRRGQG